MPAITEPTEQQQHEAEAERLLRERLAAAGNGADENGVSAPDPEPEQEQPRQSIDEDDVEKPVEHREWRFSGNYKVRGRGGDLVEQPFEGIYVQKPLSYGGMMEFTGLLGRKIDEAMSGPEGLSIDGISGGVQLPISVQDGQFALQSTDFASADGLVRGLAKLAAYVPDIIFEAQCIWLRVPRHERPLLMDLWSRPVDEGGLSMDDGEEMMSIFLDQNYEELERFFVERLRRVAARARKARERSRLTKPVVSQSA